MYICGACPKDNYLLRVQNPLTWQFISLLMNLVSLLKYHLIGTTYLVQQALVGEGSDEEQLFSTRSSLTRDGIGSVLDVYHEKIKV